jgi:hypothetical protein
MIQKIEDNMDARTTPLQATIVTAEQALVIKPFGLNMKVLLTTEASGGAISVIIGWHKPGEGPPDHVHFSQEEIFYIVDGIYELRVGDPTEAVGPAPSSSSRATWSTASRTSATRRRACSIGAYQQGRTTTSKRSPSWPPAAGSTGEKVMEISKKCDTNLPAAH